MEIIIQPKNSGRGIYAKSVAVDPCFSDAGYVSENMIKWFDITNGNFVGEFTTAYAIAHAQVCDWDKPLNLMVLSKDLLWEWKKSPEGKNTFENYYFEDRAIFNCEILEAPEKIEVDVPRRKIGKAKDGKVEVEIEIEKKEMPNTIEVLEGCMSFPHRKPKHIKRKYRIKVRYQYVGKGILGKKTKTFEGWVEGLKAHIIQHECDHFNAKTIYYNS